MPARSLVCPCGRTLGTISRKRDHRGRPVDKLVLNRNHHHVSRFWGYVECQCGERTKLPDSTKVELA